MTPEKEKQYREEFEQTFSLDFSKYKDGEYIVTEVHRMWMAYRIACKKREDVCNERDILKNENYELKKQISEKQEEIEQLASNHIEPWDERADKIIHLEKQLESLRKGLIVELDDDAMITSDICKHGVGSSSLCKICTLEAQNGFLIFKITHLKTLLSQAVPWVKNFRESKAITKWLKDVQEVVK